MKPHKNPLRLLLISALLLDAVHSFASTGNRLVEEALTPASLAHKKILEDQPSLRLPAGYVPSVFHGGAIGQGDALKLVDRGLASQLTPLTRKQRLAIGAATDYLEQLRIHPPATATSEDLEILHLVHSQLSWLLAGTANFSMGTFHAIVRAPELYLLAFGTPKQIGLSIELLGDLQGEPALFAEVLFHEVWSSFQPEQNKVDHRSRYLGTQRRLFGTANPLQQRIRQLITTLDPLVDPNPNKDLDLRAAEAGLLHPTFIDHATAVKDAVNPTNEEGLGVYIGSGAGISEFFLSLNASKALFVDPRYANISLSEFKEGFSAAGSAIEEEGVIDYMNRKYFVGYGSLASSNSKRKLVASLRAEIMAIGVDVTHVTFEEKQGLVVLHFPWTYKGQPERMYQIVFFPDLFQKVTPRVLSLAGANRFQWFYQRAGMSLPDDYIGQAAENGYLEKAEGLMSKDGFFITDDISADVKGNYIDRAAHFPLKDRVMQIPLELGNELEDRVLAHRLHYRAPKAGLFPEDDPENFYGWRVNVRQKMVVVSPATSQNPIVNLGQTILRQIMSLLRLPATARHHQQLRFRNRILSSV